MALGIGFPAGLNLSEVLDLRGIGFPAGFN
jgi:hypothetical protein